MSSRKEQKEKLRREREERERAAKEAERRRRLIGYGAGGALVLAAVVATAVALLGGGGGGGKASATAEAFPGGGQAPTQQISDLGAATKAAGCEVKDVKADSRDHTQSLAERVKYKTNPPTSGRHFVTPAADGIYATAPQDEELVHTLEHGRIIVWVKPNLPAKARADLKALFMEDSDKLVLVPRANMPYDVAASAWTADPPPLGTGHLLGCKRYGPRVFDALRAFRDLYRYKGPEPAV